MLKKILIGTAVVVIIIILAGGIAVNKWTNTPYGKLDTPTAVFIKIWELIAPDFNKMSVQEYRSKMDAQQESAPGKAVEVAQIKDDVIKSPAGDIPIRIYIPGKKERMPVIIYFHGGGFVVGSIKGSERITRYLAKKTESVVISVDYRLAPENKFPAAVDDAYSTLKWAAQNAGTLGGDPSRIAVSGDSAGGTISAAVSLMTRDKNGPKIKYQILLYPATDVFNRDTQSYNNFAEGFFLTREMMQWFIAQYLPDKNARLNPYASPLLARSHKNLPAAVIITAQFDPLRDEGEAYAEKLKQSGIHVSLKRYDGMIHGFISMDMMVPQAFQALDFVADELKAGAF